MRKDKTLALALIFAAGALCECHCGHGLGWAIFAIILIS